MSHQQLIKYNITTLNLNCTYAFIIYSFILKILKYCFRLIEGVEGIVTILSYWQKRQIALTLKKFKSTLKHKARKQLVRAPRPQCIIFGGLLWCERFFAVYLFIVFSLSVTFKMLYFESSKVRFCIKVLKFETCHGNLSHMRVKFSHFCLFLVAQIFVSSWLSDTGAWPKKYN